MATIRFKAHGKWVTFATASKSKAKKAGARKRKGTWPKGKVPKHLKKYLFK